MRQLMKQVCSMVWIPLIILPAIVACGGGSDGAGSPGDAVISISAIPGVVMPVRDAVPDTTAIETEQYTGTISWAPADNPFKATTVYTATVILTPKTGFTLAGVAENFFTVAGAEAANASDSGTVTAVFPATGAASDIDITFQNAVQTGGASGTTDSTGLTLSFSADPATLTADNITVTGATKGALSGTGTTRHLAITDITVANGEIVSVSMTSPPGYTIEGSPCDASVYRISVANMTIGMNYRGGKLAYILQAGDPGFDANIPHGIIAAPEDQSAGVIWAIASCQLTAVPGGTTELFGDGTSNTNAIIAQNGEGDSYAAGLARSYRGGGYTDWYLPSTSEMNKLYLNRAAIGGFRVEYYWVSSEESASKAWGLYLDGGYKGQANKSSLLPVRAIRSF